MVYMDQQYVITLLMSDLDSFVALDDDLIPRNNLLIMGQKNLRACNDDLDSLDNWLKSIPAGL